MNAALAIKAEAQRQAATWPRLTPQQTERLRTLLGQGGATEGRA